MGKFKEIRCEIDERLTEASVDMNAGDLLVFSARNVLAEAEALKQNLDLFKASNTPAAAAVEHVITCLQADANYLATLAEVCLGTLPAAKRIVGCLAMVLVAFSIVACSSLPKLKDFNRIGAGMTRKQVIAELGEPKSSKMVDGREILEYDASDDGEAKPRIVVLEDREVIFFGKPSEYARQQEAKGHGSEAHVTTTVSPTISPVISPVFNVSSTSPAASSAPASVAIDKASQYNNGERMIWVHDKTTEPKSAQGE